MPDVYSYSSKFEQPVRINFQCEYCGHGFTVEGKLTAGAKTEKWMTARTAEAQLELRQRGEFNLQNTRTTLEHFLERGTFPSKYDSEGKTIQFNKGNTCPGCGYHQRMAGPPAAPMKVKLLRSVAGFGCGGSAVFFYVVILFNFIRGVEFDLRPFAVPILIGVPLLAVLGAFLFQKPNRAFMKEHGLKKQDLPQPRRPEIQYGQITAAR